MARTDEKLILLGKRCVIEDAYREIECWRCAGMTKNPICDFCLTLDVSLYLHGLDVIKELSDEEVEKLYKEIEEYENKRYK